MALWSYWWPLNNVGVWGASLTCCWESMYNFRLPQNLATKSLRMVDWDTWPTTKAVDEHIWYVVCIIYAFLQ